jgi:hypothetical protein
MAAGRAWIKHHVKLLPSSERGPVNRQASTGAIIVRVLELFDKILQTQLAVVF